MAVEKQESADRRGSGRAETQRRAVYRRANAMDAGREATVTNVGPLGLALRLTEPLEVGQSLEIEVFPRDDDATARAMTVRGRVCHIALESPGAWLAGVRMYVGIQSERAEDRPRPNIAQVRDAMARLDLDSARGLVAEFDDRGAQEESEEDQRNSPKKRRWWSLLALLLLLLFAVSWAAWRDSSAQPAAPRMEERGHFVLVPEDGQPGIVSETASLESTDAVDFSVVSTGLDRAWGLLNVGEPQQALDRYQMLREIGRLTPVEAFIARLGEATALWNLDRGDRARATLAALELEPVGDVPAVWQQRAALLAEAMEAGKPTEELRGPEPAVEIGQAAPAVAEAPLTLSVSLSDYVLRVEQNGEVAAAFPVGLGANNTTPAGTFVISNKIARPDWYDRGRSVPYGDPENPLGDHWMGLAAAGGPEGIGLHGTNEPMSVGDNFSRGCIRMYPEDIAALFEWVEPGTEVRIAP